MSIAEEIELLPKKLENGRTRVKEAKSSFDKIKDEYSQSEKGKKDKEDELEELQEKIEKLKAKSTEIKTNKEYEAHLKEIQNFEDSKSHIEDNILLVMEKLDSLSKDLKHEELKLRKVEEDFKYEEEKLGKERDELYADMEKHKTERKELIAGIDNDIYEEYMRKIKSTGGIAVVQTRDEVCMGCHTNIPPQLFNDIKNGREIFTCYHCNRFLFYAK
jgi:predicted  nucleic acid-binding Zn-ribbon protein